MELRRIKNKRLIDRVMNKKHEDETLDDLSPDDVFERCLDMHTIPQEEREELTASYHEIMRSLYEDDAHSE